MGIIEQIENEVKEAKLAELAEMQKLAESAQKQLEEIRKLKQEIVEPSVSPGSLVVNVKLANCLTDVILPNDYKNGEQYAIALRDGARKTPKGLKPGYVITVQLNGLTYTRRVVDPVENERDVFLSAQLVMAISRATNMILNRKSPDQSTS